MLIVRPELYKRTRIAICVCGFCASLQIESIILLGPRMGGKLSPCSIPDGTLCIINKRHEIRDLTRNAQQSRMSPSRAIVCVCVGKHHMTPPWLINYALAFLFSLHTFMQFIITALRGSAEKSTRWNTNCLFLHTPIYLSIYAYTSDLFTEGGAHVYCGQHTHTKEELRQRGQAANEMRAGFLSCLPSSLGQDFSDCPCPLGAPINNQDQR